MTNMGHSVCPARSQLLTTTVQYGVWLLSGVRPLSNARYWREDSDGSSLPTPFSRAIGIRLGDYSLSFSGVIGEMRRDHRSLPLLLTGIFGRSFVSARPLDTPEALSRHLQLATGFAVISAPGLRLRTVPGLARLVATARIKLERPGQ